MKKILFFFILFFANFLLAQNNQTLDSLKLEMEIANSPSQRINLLIEASKTARELSLLK